MEGEEDRQRERQFGLPRGVDHREEEEAHCLKWQVQGKRSGEEQDEKLFDQITQNRKIEDQIKRNKNARGHFQHASKDMQKRPALADFLKR